MNKRRSFRFFGWSFLVVLLAAGCRGTGAELGPPSPVASTTTLTIPPAMATFTSTPAPPTPPPTAPPTETPSGNVQDIRTLCLAETGDLTDVVEKKLTDFLESALKLDVGKPGQAPCEAVLSMDLKAVPLGFDYVRKGYTPPTPLFNSQLQFLNPPVGSQHCYNGAQIDGVMSLGLQGQSFVKTTISSRKSPPAEIGFCLEADHAPYYEVWPRLILDGLAHFWGPAVYVKALIHPEALGESEIVRQAAAEGLKEASGKDYGENAQSWNRWLEQQSLKPLRLPHGKPAPELKRTVLPP